jgi:hypothetical protein
MFLPPDASAMYYRIVLVIVALLTAFSSFITAREFDRTDRLYLSWLLLGAGYTVAAIRYLLRIYTLLTGGGITNPIVINGLLILQNLLVPVSLFLFVRAWRATGLAAPVSAAAQRLSMAAGVGVAVLVGGFPLLRGIANANADLVLLVSTAGDMIALALIVPLMLPALALRGGLLMHTWAYLTAGIVAWLAYDIWYALRESMPFAQTTARGIEEGIRVVAIMFACVASVAQRRAVRG